MLKLFGDVEKTLVIIALAIVTIAAIVDYHEDWLLGATFNELMLDTILNIFVIGTLLYILRHRPLATRVRNHYLEQAVHYSNEDLKRWKSKAAELLHGLGEKINEQFDCWHLSKAEKEVALLLIKGVSIKELSEWRGTSEKTVRQQASQVYAKAKLQNRAELAAFFLEDLLLP